MTRNNRTRAPRNGGFPGATRAESGPAGGTLPSAGEVRIVGGEWRGRKLRFPAAAGLRPTPDRVRETLFNWLQFELAGRRCLDLFAGSGALGLEALSRGAAEVVLVEQDPVAAAGLRASLQALRCERGRVEPVDAFAYLAQPATRRFDVVFLDPPYARRWLGPACEALERGDWLAPEAWVYLEDAAAQGEPALPAGWTLRRSKRAGDVGYHLARRGGRPDQNEPAEGSA